MKPDMHFTNYGFIPLPLTVTISIISQYRVIATDHHQLLQ